MRLRNRLQNGQKRLVRGVMFVLLYLLEHVGLQEVLTVTGTAMITVGLWGISHAIALVVCGTILLWYALPARPPLISRPESLRKER